MGFNEDMQKMKDSDPMGFDSPKDDLSGAPLESLREELNHINRGLDELMRRRLAVTTAINIKLDDTRMHLGSSEEFFAKITGQYPTEGPVNPEYVGRDQEVPEEYRRRF